MESAILLSLILIPLVSAFVSLLFSGNSLKSFAAFSGILSLAVSVFVLIQLNSASGSNSFQYSISYLPSLGQSLSIGLNGLSATLVFLSALLSFVVLFGVIGNDTSVSKGMVFNVLLLESFLMGVFSAQDLISFYIFWEATLIPMYFLIGIWGGADRIKANLVFFIFTMIGSLFLLVGIIFLGLEGAKATADPTKLFISDFKTLSLLLTNQQIPSYIFWFIFSGFGIKAAIFPLHAWLPKTYTEAPYSALILLSGAMAKMGTYGMIIFGFYFLKPLLVENAALLGFLAAVGIIYAAWIASTKKSIKEIIAFSSMSHMGFIILGVIAGTFQSVSGASIQMLNHGISTGALFLLVYFLANRSENPDKLSGVANSSPILATSFIISSLSSIGLPGLNGFVGEFQILLGSFRSYNIPVFITAFATLGVVLAAVYMLLPVKKLFFGDSEPKISDLTGKEIAAILPLLILMVWIGVAPSSFLNLTQTTVEFLLR